MWTKLITIIIFSGIVAGMGIGGGGIFVIVSSMFSLFEQKQAQGYNLIMFIAVGIATTIINIKDNVFDKKMLIKILPAVVFGSFVGIHFAKIIEEEKIRKYFLIFMLIIGIYEIIVSLKNIKKGKLKLNERS